MTFKSIISKRLVVILFALLIINISCKKDDVRIPSLTTYEVYDITPTSAKSGSVITDYGGSEITAKGVCWSTKPEPTTNDFSTNDGKGTDNYISQLTGLTENTLYYVRAYATNSLGTGYGLEVPFVARYDFPGETVKVEGGTFDMGSNDGNDDEKPIHAVTLNDFYISKYEITNTQYALFLNAVNVNVNGIVDGVEYLDADSSGVQIHYSSGEFVADAGKNDYPAIEIPWYGAHAYCEYYGGRLPTEAEWEFAAKGGNSSNGYTYSGSNTIGDVAWYLDNSTNPDNDMEEGKGTHIIGTKNSNELGIYDMSGNIYEWCSDWYAADYYSNSPTNNPIGASSGSFRVLRSGCWYFEADYSLVFARTNGNPMITGTIIGFRPVFDF